MGHDKTPREKDKGKDAEGGSEEASGFDSESEAIEYRAGPSLAEEGRVEAEQTEEVTEDRRA